MKMLSTRKRAGIVTIALILVLALAAGLTYAWFSYEVQTPSAKSNMGRLRIACTMDTDPDPFPFAPGEYTEKEGTLSNIGDLGAIAMVTAKADVLMKSDTKGDPLDPSQYWTSHNDSNVTAKFDETMPAFGDAGHSSTNPDAMYIWFGVDGMDDTYIVLMDPGSEADILYNIEFSGAGMDNRYQGAEVSFSNKWVATQPVDAAMALNLNGITMDDLVDLDPTNPFARTASPYQQVKAQLLEKYPALLG